ncbi:hypothetical protein [Sphaerisporangium dianthi]|uniref:Uncharacterized protein n=1 Tax=Sphaerisporangium dianthi TaxID=1436120 RepID=A0ABV9CKY6_9ACTN
MNDIDKLVRAIDPAPRAPERGPGARELRAAIMAEEQGTAGAGPRRARRHGRRLVLALGAAALLATGVAAGPGRLWDGAGMTPVSYAVTKDSDGIVYVTIRDFSDADGLRRQLRDLDVPAIVDHVPHGTWCRDPRGTVVRDKPAGLYSVPEGIPGDDGSGWRMRIDTKLFKPGQTFVWTISESPGGGSRTSTILYQGPVAPCALIPEPTRKLSESDLPYRVATVEGRSLAGFRVDEKTVGEVLPELRRRGLKVVFAVMSIPPGNPGGYGIVRTQKTPVGDGWVVWEAEESTRTPGLVRLLVTEHRLDGNPVYGGPRDRVS